MDIDTGHLCIIVVTELDGLARQQSSVGRTAAAAVSFLEDHIKISSVSLKIQTAKGNYLSNLFIRSEMFDAPVDHIATSATHQAESMDDFILKVAFFQTRNFLDRSLLLTRREWTLFEEKSKHCAHKVCFLTYDRNLRLRAAAWGISAATEQQVDVILSGEL